MFKIQTRDFDRKWKDLRFANRYQTEEAAWEKVASFDPDGIADRTNYRVVSVK